MTAGVFVGCKNSKTASRAYVLVGKLVICTCDILCEKCYKTIVYLLTLMDRSSFKSSLLTLPGDDGKQLLLARSQPRIKQISSPPVFKLPFLPHHFNALNRSNKTKLIETIIHRLLEELYMCGSQVFMLDKFSSSLAHEEAQKKFTF